MTNGRWMWVAKEWTGDELEGEGGKGRVGRDEEKYPSVRNEGSVGRAR